MALEFLQVVGDGAARAAHLLADLTQLESLGAESGGLEQQRPSFERRKLKWFGFDVLGMTGHGTSSRFAIYVLILRKEGTVVKHRTVDWDSVVDYSRWRSGATARNGNRAMKVSRLARPQRIGSRPLIRASQAASAA